VNRVHREAGTGSSARRFAARARSRRLLAVRPALLTLTLAASVGGAGWVVLGSDLLAVRSVDVSGQQRLDARDVLVAADLSVGRPLVLVDTDAISARITAALVPVREVTVQRAWPDAVRIEVRERVPAAALPDAGRVHLVDAEGVVFAVQPDPPPGVPLVDAPPDAGSDSLRAAVAVVTALPPKVSALVTSVTADSPDAVELALTGGRTVRWGGPERSARKAAVLTVLLHRPAAVYDVSAPDAPTTRP
jgi:cell division protein FtsQ